MRGEEVGYLYFGYAELKGGRGGDRGLVER